MTRTRNLVLLLVVASVALILWDLRASDAALRSAAQQVITPLQRTATAMFAPFGQWARDVQAFSEPAARQQTAAPALAAGPAGWRSAVGRVVAADITGGRAGVTIDVGRTAGVREGNAVLAPGGLVGRIDRVFDDSASVLLISDPRSKIGVRLLTSREMGVLSGVGLGEDLSLEILNPAARVDPGDQVVSLGSEQRTGIPSGLPVGSVTGLDTQPVDSGRAASVHPVTGLTTLDTLVVLTDPA